MEHVRRAGCASLWTRGRFVMSRLERMRRRECHGVPRDAVATVAVHADARARAHAQRRAPDGYEHDLDIAPPIGVSATFEAADGGPVYSRANAPTRERAEAVLAAVEMAASAGRTPVRALLYASGAAATHAALHDMLSRRGCVRVRVSGGYHGTHAVLAQLRAIRPDIEVADLPAEPALRRWLAAAGSAERQPREELEQADLVRRGDVFWLETPNNPGCAVADVALFVQAARAVRPRAQVVVDSTFAPPPAQAGLLGAGVDLVLHSTTKSICGHSDALGGALLVPSRAAQPSEAGGADAGGDEDYDGDGDEDYDGDGDEDYDALRAQRTALGAVPGSLEAWLLLRSLRTLELRVGRQCESATRLAAWLAGSGARGADGSAGGGGGGGGRAPGAAPVAMRAAALRHVAAVHHPSLPGSAGHAAAKVQMRLFGGVLALELRSAAAARALPGRLRLFRNATSLGGVESLAEWRHKYDASVSPRLVRLSCGVEDFDDLCDDLARAIVAASDEAAEPEADDVNREVTRG